MEHQTWKDAQGIIWGFCCICDHEVSTRDDAGRMALEYCGDCRRPTCHDHREDTLASRCDECHAEYSAYLSSMLRP